MRNRHRARLRFASAAAIASRDRRVPLPARLRAIYPASRWAISRCAQTQHRRILWVCFLGRLWLVRTRECAARATLSPCDGSIRGQSVDDLGLGARRPCPAAETRRRNEVESSFGGSPLVVSARCWRDDCSRGSSSGAGRRCEAPRADGGPTTKVSHRADCPWRSTRPSRSWLLSDSQASTACGHWSGPVRHRGLP